MLMRLKKITLALCVMGMSGAVWAQPVLVKAEQNIEEYRLENGFRVILAPNAKETKVFMNTIYFTGSLNDPQGQGGLAHLLEHLAFKGTQDIPYDGFQNRLNQLTLNNNASTGYYATKYTNTLRPEAKALQEMIYLEAQRMDKLVLQEKFVPTEIDIVKREREIRLDQPFSVLTDQILKSAYGNQHLGRLPIGDLNELQSIKIKALEKFYRDWYAPNNAVMVISGKFDQADALKHIEKNFAPIAARQIPAQAQVPVLDPTKIQPKHLEVEKGSHFVQVHTYLNQQDDAVKTALALAPLLYTMQPSGSLYQNMVTTKTAMGVNSSTWIDQDFNLAFFAAVYGPQHDAKNVATALQQGVESTPKFDEKELQRIKNLVKNSQESVFKSATALGNLLSDYVVSEQGNWTQYFVDQKNVQNLTVTEVNQKLAQFFVPELRITALIKPTPEDQKQAQQAQANTVTNTAKTETPSAERFKPVAEYEQEIQGYLKTSKQALQKNEAKIVRGDLKNGLQYALFSTTTQDDKIYANIEVPFGRAESLKDQAAVIDLTNYLLLRGSQKYSLQDMTDKTIEVNGSATVRAAGNSFNIRIVANKGHFEDYFQYIMQALKQPRFDETEFNLAQSQTLASLDRPYTEPDFVASLALSRAIEVYDLGDLRHHFEPEYNKAQFKHITRQQVVNLYEKYFAMNHAKVAITGEFDAKKMQKLLKNNLEKWNTPQAYSRLEHHYTAHSAEKIHALAEQREFGSYQAGLFFPVGTDHEDVAALQIFRHILADSQLSSRLALELREKNALVYGFSGNVTFNEWNHSGVLSLGANYSAGKSQQVSQAVHKVLQDLIDNGVTAQEVAAAKAALLKKRVTSLEDERRIHSSLIAQLEKNRNLLFREKRDQAIAQITPEDVHQAIKKHIRLEHFVEVMADQYGKTIVKP